MRYFHHRNDGSKWHKGEISGIEALREGEVGYKRAKDNLKSAVNRKKVELRNMMDVDFDCLACDVYIDGEDVRTKL